MADKSPWQITRGAGPIVAAAVHEGSTIRSEIKPYLAISDAARLTEEDPCTGTWAQIAPTRIVGQRSRFEFDLNRPLEKAIYLHPADSWGLTVWNTDLPAEHVAESQRLYNAFYAEVDQVLQELVSHHEQVVVYDLHTYNHRRRGPYAEFDDPELNPEVNLGTRTMHRDRWDHVVDRWIADLSEFDFLGRRLDVRENIKFFGGNLARWIHEQFADSVCVLSIEFKKFFMDEWTGQVDEQQSAAIQQALASTLPGVLEEIRRR